MQKPERVYQSKWGYHPISLASSKKLRYLNAAYAKAQSMAGSWERWQNKQPKNRILKRIVKNSIGQKIGSEYYKDSRGNLIMIPEPQIFYMFFHSINSVRRSENDVTNMGKTVDIGLGQKILRASRQERIPYKNPEDVRALLFSEEEIDRLYSKAKSWMDMFTQKKKILRGPRTVDGSFHYETELKFKSSDVYQVTA
jgi:hypothetical protein